MKRSEILWQKALRTATTEILLFIGLVILTGHLAHQEGGFPLWGLIPWALWALQLIPVGYFVQVQTDKAVALGKQEELENWLKSLP